MILAVMGLGDLSPCLSIESGTGIFIILTEVEMYSLSLLHDFMK